MMTQNKVNILVTSKPNKDLKNKFKELKDKDNKGLERTKKTNTATQPVMTQIMTDQTMKALNPLLNQRMINHKKNKSNKKKKKNMNGPIVNINKE